jgi:hypothetical protein
MDTMTEMPIEVSATCTWIRRSRAGAGDGGMLNEVDDELIDPSWSGSWERRS